MPPDGSWTPWRASCSPQPRTLADRDTSRPTLGTVVAALVERVGQRARSEGADEEFIAALTYTVWIAAEGMTNRARAATAVPD